MRVSGVHITDASSKVMGDFSEAVAQLGSGLDGADCRVCLLGPGDNPIEMALPTTPPQHLD